MTEQTKDPLTALAKQYATKYTNRHTPCETAFAFGPEAWQEFCKAVQALAIPVVPANGLTEEQISWLPFARSLVAQADAVVPAPGVDGLLPCPFCASTQSFKSRRFDGAEIFRVGCNVCTASVADCGKDAAIAAWNRRPPQQSAQPVQPAAQGGRQGCTAPELLLRNGDERSDQALHE